MKINEISKMSHITGKDWVPVYGDMPFKGIVRQSKPLPGMEQYRYIIRTNKDLENNASVIRIIAIDPKAKPSGHWKTREALGILSIKKHPWFTNAYQVEKIMVADEFQGKGIGKTLYSIVLKTLKLTLLAGGDQSHAGQRSWASLYSMPGVEVTGYGLLEDGVFEDLRPESLTLLLDAIVDAGANFIGKIKKWGNTYHIFQFPVQVAPDKILQIAIKNSKIDVYGSGNYPFSFVDTGLMATWIGK
jgi:GNAT superfamily N-acetyltransferase